MEDGLQDDAGGIRDVCILPVKRNAVGGAIPVPETQRAGTSRYRELLIERAISKSLGREAAEAIGCIASKSGEGSAVRLGIRYHRRRVCVLNYPRWEAAGLESAVEDEPGITWRRRRCWTCSRCWRRRP